MSLLQAASDAAAPNSGSFVRLLKGRGGKWVEVIECRGHYLMSLPCSEEQNVSLLGRQGQLEEPAQSSHLNH